MVREIEAAARLPVTGLISNTHLMGETTPEIVRRGLPTGRARPRPRLGVPVVAVGRGRGGSPRRSTPGDVRLPAVPALAAADPAAVRAVAPAAHDRAAVRADTERKEPESVSQIVIDRDLCKGCELCVNACPQKILAHGQGDQRQGVLLRRRRRAEALHRLPPVLHHLPRRGDHRCGSPARCTTTSRTRGAMQMDRPRSHLRFRPHRGPGTGHRVPKNLSAPSRSPVPGPRSPTPPDGTSAATGQGLQGSM